MQRTIDNPEMLGLSGLENETASNDFKGAAMKAQP